MLKVSKNGKLFRTVKRNTKIYAFNGLEGCVAQRKSRQTGTLIGIYQGIQSGMESDREVLWQTVCEEHSTCIGSSSRKLAEQAAAYPRDWCELCRITPRMRQHVVDATGLTVEQVTSERIVDVIESFTSYTNEGLEKLLHGDNPPPRFDDATERERLKIAIATRCAAWETMAEEALSHYRLQDKETLQ